MVIPFCGKRMPYYINYSGIPVRCYLYKRTVPYCRKSNETGHRDDVCPQPSTTPRCGKCGLALIMAQHECHPQCILCGGTHPTAHKSCTKRYLPPVNRQKPQRQQQQSSRQTRSSSLNSVVVVRAFAILAHQRGAVPAREGASLSAAPGQG
ncbi:hypothetical protein HPB48_005658 [Haemaphysalis longicornis]|uniref:Uncharacterized protein n=1 Tax=Haemaphysalis longicornis TaxID=44386 RepID=A0A9J6GA07_HAELO|nr:hypothetical protein HPB48_005658 [Haemaphysalis longicornis]